MRTLLLTGTAVAALFTGLAAASAQTAEQPRQPNARQERQDAGPGRSESAPGQNRPAAGTAAPGRSESAPGQNRPQADTSAPGKSESAPGQNRTTTGAAGDDPNLRRQGQNADQNNRRQSQTDDETRRDRTQAQGEDRNPALRGDDRNRNAGGDRDGDRNRRQADDQQGRDTNPALRTGERDRDRGEDRNRRTEDLQDRERDRNRQAGDDRDRDRDGPKVKLSVKLKGDEKTKITANLVERAKPVEKTKIKFNINVGTTVPRGTVELYELPPTVISIVPEYRSYRYFVVEDEIVIVEPSTYRIVEVIERSGSSRATGAARLTIDSSKFGLIKRELRPRGDIKVRFTVREGAVLPDDVELWEVPQTVITEVPELRSYRYVVYQNEVVLVEPQTRRIVEVID